MELYEDNKKIEKKMKRRKKVNDINKTKNQFIKKQK